MKYNKRIETLFIKILLFAIILLAPVVSLAETLGACIDKVKTFAQFSDNLENKCINFSLINSFTISSLTGFDLSGSDKSASYRHISLLNDEYAGEDEVITIKAGSSLGNYEFAGFKGKKVFKVSQYTLNLNNVKFTDSFYPVLVEANGIFSCVNCNAEEASFEIHGEATISNSSLNRLIKFDIEYADYVILGDTTVRWPVDTKYYSAPSIVIDSSKKTTLKFSDFGKNNPLQSTLPFIEVKNGEAEIRSNKFWGRGILIKVDAGGDEVLVTNNKFYTGLDELTDISTFITADPSSKTGKLEDPVIAYSGHDEKNFKIKIINKFDAAENVGYWGTGTRTVCSGSSVRSGTAASVSFEPYAIEHGNMYPLGVYQPVKEGSGANAVYYLKLDLTKMIALNSFTPVSLPLSGFKKIAMLVHCEGAGTSNFSNILSLGSVCPSGQINNGTACYDLCSKDADCEFGITCIDRMCIGCETDDQCKEGFSCSGDGRCISDTAPVCDENSDCGNGYECIEGNCLPAGDPLICESNADCDEGYICQDSACVENKGPETCASNSDCPNGYCSSTDHVCESCAEVPLICSDGKDVIKEGNTTYCYNKKDPLCPANSTKIDACGDICVCKPGYKLLGDQCVDVLTNAVCPTGMGLSKESQTCVESKVTAGGSSGKSGGGCSLIL